MNQFNAFKAPGRLFEKVPHSYYNHHNIYILRQDFDWYIQQHKKKKSSTLGYDLVFAVGAVTFSFLDMYKFGLCFKHEL